MPASRKWLIAAIFLSIAAVVIIAISHREKASNPAHQRISKVLYLSSNPSAAAWTKPNRPVSLAANAELASMMEVEGTNAIPALIEVLEQDRGPTKLQKAAQWLCLRCRALTRNQAINEWVWADVKARTAARRVPDAFFFLGTNALPAAPELKRLAKRVDNVGNNARAAMVQIKRATGHWPD